MVGHRGSVPGDDERDAPPPLPRPERSGLVTPPGLPLPSARASGRAVGVRLAALFDQHAGMVLGLCRLLLRDHHEAEDAAQQTFVSAYRSLLRGSEPREEAPWLAAIARNECRARIRKRMRAPLALEGALENELSDPVDLAELADRRAELAEIKAAMAELPSRQREAVALRDFLGLSYEEVASTLAVSVPVVEALLFRARRRLRDQVRAVPRLATGVVAVPLALRAAVARDVPDFDSVTSGAGLLGGAAVALAAGAAKLVSLPFASKAATAVAVVIAGTAVAPQVSGLLERQPLRATVNVGVSTVVEPGDAPAPTAAGEPAEAAVGTQDEAVPETAPVAGGAGAPAGGDDVAAAADLGDQAVAGEPVRTDAAAAGGADDLVLPPLPGTESGAGSPPCAESGDGAGSPDASSGAGSCDSGTADASGGPAPGGSDPAGDAASGAGDLGGVDVPAGNAQPAAAAAAGAGSSGGSSADGSAGAAGGGASSAAGGDPPS